MTRQLDTATLDGAAQYYASRFLLNAGRFNREFVIKEFYKLTFRDEFEYLARATQDALGKAVAAEFRAEMEKLRADHPRDDAVFEQLLADKLAIDPAGKHIAGKIGTTQLGNRFIRFADIEVESPDSLRWRRMNGVPKWAPGPDGKPLLQRYETTTKRAPLYWPIYAGEGEERAANSGVADPLPPGTPGLPVGAFNMNISAETAILGLDALLDNLDEGTGAAVIQGRTGAQPVDPDAVTTGTLLFTCVCTDPAFNAAADQADGTVQAAAAAITDDTSADATGTVGYCRASATNDGATPLDDHIDGEAATATADFVFNTTSITAGATVSITSWTVTLDQGTTAT